jgi:hypothetical protein
MRLIAPLKGSGPAAPSGALRAIGKWREPALGWTFTQHRL